jgi:hypothetical protein
LVGVGGGRLGAPNVTALTWKNSGNVGINNTNPTYTLDVNGFVRIKSCMLGDIGFGAAYTGFCHESLFNQPANYALLQQNNGATFINCAATRSIHFRESNVDRMVITNGRLGIGTTSPATTLDIVGAISMRSNLSCTAGDLKYNVTDTRFHDFLSGSNLLCSMSYAFGQPVVSCQGLLKTKKMALGLGNTKTYEYHDQVNVGTSIDTNKQMTYTLPTIINGTYNVYITLMQDANDMFTVKIINKTSTSFTYQVVRVVAAPAGWGTDVYAQFHIVEYAN